jgi:hypothetical protein
MELPDRRAAPSGRWTSLWVVALISFVAQLALCQFFSPDPKTHGFGETVPFSEDINPSKLWELAYTFPPTGTFQVLNWLGVAYQPQPLNPLSLAAAWMTPWLFFTTYVPILATLALLAMAAFLREMEISRPAALFAAVIYAWQGDILAFIYPGHYGYLTSWPFYALAAWGTLRADRTGRWPYALISGACCGLIVGLLTNADRGGIASLLIGVLFLAPLLRRGRDWARTLRHFALCVGVALVVALAQLLALFKTNITNVHLGDVTTKAESYNLVVQYSLGPAETLTYLVPGFFGWHSNSLVGRYWGWIGEWPGWEKYHTGPANLNLAISTCGTTATLLALMGAVLVLPGRLFGPDQLSDRQRFYARVLLACGLGSLVLSWGQHIGPVYRFIFDHVPLMDKWRDPLKWLEMFNFALMPLGALGLDHLAATLAPGPAPARRRFLWFLGLALVALFAGLIASYALAYPFIAHFLRQGLDQVVVADMLSTLHLALGGAMVLTFLLGLVPFALWHADTLRRWTLVNPWLQRLWENMLRPGNLPLTLALALALLSAVQLGCVAQHFIEPTPMNVLTMTNPLLEALRRDGDRVRCSVAVDDVTLNFLLQNQFAAMDISCLDISAASRYPEDYTKFLHVFDKDHAPLWFLAGVKNLVVPESATEDVRSQPDISTNIDRMDGYTLAPTPSPDVPSHALIVLKDYLAKATLVPDYDALPRADVLKRLTDSAWHPRERVLLALADAGETDPASNGDLAAPGKVEFPPSSGAPGSLDQVEVKTYTPTEIDLAVESTRNAFVLINDYYDHDWSVQINGQDAPLLRADYLLRAIAVPAGSSTITLHYVPHYLGMPARALCLLSDGALLAAFIVAGLALRRKPKD